MAPECSNCEGLIQGLLREETSRLSKSDIQKILSVSFVLVCQTIDILEKRGAVCRDESLSGVFFYGNQYFAE